MDINKDLIEQRNLAINLLDGIKHGNYKSLAQYEDDVNRLCGLFMTLDAWLNGGNALPEDWITILEV